MDIVWLWSRVVDWWDHLSSNPGALIMAVVVVLLYVYLLQQLVDRER